MAANGKATGITASQATREGATQLSDTRPGTREAAAAFAQKWHGHGDERQDTQRYWIDLLHDVLGIENATDMLMFEARTETNAKNGNGGYADVLIPSASAIVEQKSLGIDLDKPEKRQGREVTPVQQAYGYVEGMPDAQKPRWVITSDFARIRVYDRNADPMCRKAPVAEISIDALPQGGMEALSFLKEAKDDTQGIVTAHAVSIKAGEIMGGLHDIVIGAYDDPDSPEAHHDISVLLTRLMFLMFCEDADILERDQFVEYVDAYDADDMRSALKRLFQWLDTPDDQRSAYESKRLRDFPYMGGGLFTEDTEIPALGEDFKQHLIQASRGLDWSHVSPTVFGSIFEGSLSHDHRREHGQHFTSPENIHRVTDPLFMDYLNGQFDKALAQPKRGGKRKAALERLHRHIGNISILDPACGSGNFLTESYLALRELEDRIIAAEHALSGNEGQLSFDVGDDGSAEEVLVSLRNFHGIEYEDFACCVARVALWIAKQQADATTAKVVHRAYDPLPLVDYHSIVHGNALRIDWNDVVPASDCNYVIGNPPFVGSNMRTREQCDDMDAAFAGEKKYGKVDYCGAWYHTAKRYMNGTEIRSAFVSTNSICQGEQVLPMWKPLFDAGITIDFAWHSFQWTSEAADKAGVWCVIVGFTYAHGDPKWVFSADGTRHDVTNINGYLMNAPSVFIPARGKAIDAQHKQIVQGSKPVDGGNLIINADEYDGFIARNPSVAPYVRPYIGAEEFVNGKQRYCLWLKDAPVSAYAKSAEVRKRLQGVHDARAASRTAEFRKCANTPTLFEQDRQPDTDFLLIPLVSSSERRFVPIGYMSCVNIISNKCDMILNASLYDFGLLSSTFHNAWMRIVTGRLGNGYSYNPTVYNSFAYPPAATDEERVAVERAAQSVLDARASYAPATLADMYDPDSAFLYPDLVSAHERLDAAVERAYGVDFHGDEDAIVAYLFKLYARMTES